MSRHPGADGELNDHIGDDAGEGCGVHGRATPVMTGRAARDQMAGVPAGMLASRRGRASGAAVLTAGMVNLRSGQGPSSGDHARMALRDWPADASTGGVAEATNREAEAE